MSLALPATLPLPAPGSVQVWLLAAPAVLTDAAAATIAAWLDADEQVRWQRFHHAPDRDRFLLSRALLRGVLARYCGCTPAALQFGRDDHGKPHLLAPASSLTFNLTHTHGLLALAVADGLDVGIDAENAARKVDMLPLAQRFFAPAEVAQLQALPATDLSAGFFRLWTLKEAYVKARGIGLKLGLASFTIDFAVPRLVHADAGDGSAWSCTSFVTGEALYVAAFAPAASIDWQPRHVTLDQLLAPPAAH